MEWVTPSSRFWVAQWLRSSSPDRLRAFTLRPFYLLLRSICFCGCARAARRVIALILTALKGKPVLRLDCPSDPASQGDGVYRRALAKPFQNRHLRGQHIAFVDR